jgi:hypothetical protein
MANFRIYKPNNQKSGSASQLDYRKNTRGKRSEVVLFWTITQQTGEDDNGNASFAWDSDKSKTIKMKLGLPDVGEILAVLKGRKDAVGTGKGLFHKNQNGNSVLQFCFVGATDKVPDRFSLRISTQDTQKNSLAINQTISIGEGVVLEQFLNGFLSSSFEESGKLNKPIPVSE